MGTTPLKNRIEWIDVLKGITVLLVALSHSILTVYHTIPTTEYTAVDILITDINKLLATARMPAFFLASGLVLASLTSDKYKWLINKRIPVMIWLIFVWSGISFMVEYCGLHLYPWESHPFFDSGWNYLSPYGNLWFIYALLFLSCFAVSLSKLSVQKNVLITVTTSIALYLCLKLFDLGHDINRLLIANIATKGLPFFMVGFLIKDNIIKFLNERKHHFIAYMASAVLLFIALSLIKTTSLYGKLLITYIPATFILVLTIVYVSKIELVSRIFKIVGNLSLEIFILHQFFIAIFYPLHSYISLGDITNVVLILTPILLCAGFAIAFKSTIRPYFFSLPSLLTRVHSS